MADDDAKKQPIGDPAVEDIGEGEDGKQNLTLLTILNRLIAAVFFPDPDGPARLLQRITASVSEIVPLLREASRNTGCRVLTWTRRGSTFRVLLVVSVGTIGLLFVTGSLVFRLFFAAATINFIIISLFVSVAAAGGFLALFFACVAAVYIGALTVAFFAISTASISAAIAILTAIGWIGFFWALWLAVTKGLSVAKHSISVTGSAALAYSTSWSAKNRNIPNKLY